MAVIAPTAAIAALAILFWRIRIFSGADPTISFQATDLYNELIPTIHYAFATLRAGQFPLWNPYQLCGIPLFAIGWTGILYPPHWVRLFVDPLVSLEMMLILHLFWGGLGMMLFCRHLGLRTLAGVCAATTFMWSGWFIAQILFPGILEALSWMPFVALTADRMTLGHRRAWFWLIVVLTCQLTIGMVEIFLHSIYLGGTVFCARSVVMIRVDGLACVLRRVGTASTCVAAAILLASPLLLPTAELSQLSTRAAGSLSFEQVAGYGKLDPSEFLRGTLEARGIVTVGVWPIVALPFALATRRNRAIVIACILIMVVAGTLALGGKAFQLYYHVPVVGSLFRRPAKFLDLYVFAQATLAGFALAQLIDVAGNQSARWRRGPEFPLALLCGAAGLAWLALIGSWNWLLAAVLLLLILFFAPRRYVPAAAIVATICLLQGASLFFQTGGTQLRPIKRPLIYHTHDRLFARLQRDLGNARIYLSRGLLLDPRLTAKHGQLRRVFVSTDYEPLTPQRYSDFFHRVTEPTDGLPFAGSYALMPASRWHLMNLTGTKYFVLKPGEAADTYMREHRNTFRPVDGPWPVRVYEQLAGC